MKIVKSQDMCISIPISRIARTEVQQKPENRWIVVAVVENDRAVTLARYSNEDEAISADTRMWISSNEVYVFPAGDNELGKEKDS